MKLLYLLPMLALAASGCSQNYLAARRQPIPEGAIVEKIATGYSFTEGCASDAAGNVYFTDQPNEKILRWDAKSGQTAVWLEGEQTGRANGLLIDADGRLIACADQNNEMRIYDVATKKYEVLFHQFGGKNLNGPNDVWIRPDGGMYFTDPYYQRPYWTRQAPEQDKACVYFVPAGSRVPERAAEGFTTPNGIVGTPDGKTLYVADHGGKKTWAFDINKDGALINKRLFADTGSDGMTIDNEGNVYLTRGGVLVFDKDGNKIADIKVPEGTANVCFGGADMRTLFITARTSLYSIKLKTRGVGSQ